MNYPAVNVSAWQSLEHWLIIRLLFLPMNQLAIWIRPPGEEIMQIFKDLHEAGNTVVIITHEKDIAERAKRIVHIRDGNIAEDIRN